MRHHQRAFTIIELVIVVAIILFLSKLLIPRYQGFYHKARQTEVALNLSALYACQQGHFLEHGSYATNIATLSWKPKGYTQPPGTTENSYTYGIRGGNENASLFTGSSKTPSSALPHSHLAPDRFIIGAALKNKDGVDRWSIDETGSLTHHQE